MQPLKRLLQWLDDHIHTENNLFLHQDLRALFPELTDNSFRVLLSRSVSSGYLERVCRSVYRYKKIPRTYGYLLYHTAALLRHQDFNYLSLESVLSDAGVISQLLLNRITVMSSGRRQTIDCGPIGQIEFVHTKQKIEHIQENLVYDAPCRLWRASVQQALRDMKHTHRSLDLINWEIAHEFI